LVIGDDLRARIDAEAAKFPVKRGALLAALRIVQDDLGYIGIETAGELAALFELSIVDVMEVVSFYNMLYDSPQPRHHVGVCTNLSCSLRGSRSLLRQLESHLGVKVGEATPDGRIALGHEECLGACAYAPMMRVDDRYHEDLDVERAVAVLDALD
jgi:NADH-quinone oxidoreductase subunit E